MSMKKEVTSRTIAGVLTFFIVGAILWTWSNVLLTTATSVWNWLGSSVAVPGWLLVALSCMSVLLVVGIVLLVLSNIQTQPDVPEWYAFTSMDYWDFKWRWRWVDGRPHNLGPMCPSCMRIARYAETERHALIPKFEVMCQECKHVSKIAEGSYDELLKNVHIEIDHAIHTGRWKRFVEQERAA